ncbi:MAG: sterol desaturase family protein [Fluviicola sp.]|jgi:4-hydroxysphinganine ceramide fatty acyl 2-hydroxylase
MKPQEKKRMFENPVLEFFSKSGPILMISFHLTLITGLLVISNYNFGNPFIHWGYFIAGFMLWTLAEYFLHRKLFHIVSSKKMIISFQFALHGHHHENPSDSSHLFMPPLPALIFLSLFGCVFYLFVRHFCFILLAGFDFGYLIYSILHFSIHRFKAPKIFAGLWKHHLMHHYKTPEKAYGVSSKLWDRVFNTMPK